MVTCPNEQYIIQALRLEAPEKIPSFCQSIMSKLTNEFLMKYEDDIEEEDVLLTSIGDLTVYKAFGYSSRWQGGPTVHYEPDDILKEHIQNRQEEIKKKYGSNYSFTVLGSIRASNNITSWFVEAGIRDEKELRFFLDHLTVKKPDVKQIEQWREGRIQCLQKDFVPFGAAHVVMEPANQSLPFGLTGKLMRKNPELLEEFYDLLLKESIYRFEALIKADYKCFCTPDDCAYKSGPMISPKQYRKYVMPRAKILCDMVHEADGVIFMHTDGFIDPIMDCFIDAGYDGIQPLEPTSGMTIERVKRLWGDKIATIGNVDTTTTLSFGTEKEVREYVHRCFREAKAGKDKIYGYIFAASGSLHDKVKLENALAMMDEYKKIRDGLVPI